MNHLALLLLGIVAFVLVGCGEYVPPTPTRSPIEARQTERALAGEPVQPSPTVDQQATAAVNQAQAALLTVPADDPRAIGSPSAPVTIIEYSDFE